MNFYIYDQSTKAYLYSENAYVDPLETAKQGKDVYLQPANSTTIEPLVAKAGYTVNFNGTKWVYTEVATTPVTEEPVVDPALEEVNEEITELDMQIKELKDELLTATLANDDAWIADIKQRYEELING